MEMGRPYWQNKEQKMGKEILELLPRTEKRNIGRAPRWTDDINWNHTNWIAAAQNRGEWRRLEEAYVEKCTGLG